jgi:hypothetical protein
MLSIRAKFEPIISNCAKFVPNSNPNFRYPIHLFGAGDRDRTGDIQLGKLTFYH